MPSVFDGFGNKPTIFREYLFLRRFLHRFLHFFHTPIAFFVSNDHFFLCKPQIFSTFVLKFCEQNGMNPLKTYANITFSIAHMLPGAPVQLTV